ncbi:MAG: alpha/beta hydrolase [Rhodovibrio sp.]|nr:alpha/beta hydrolase [Rhodovibrio sp.]
MLLLCLLLAACAPGRALESLTVLRDVATGAHAEAEQLGPVEIGYRVAGRARTADLYRPAKTPPAAGVVLVPGATPEGRRDPRLIAFARELAAARVAVLVPDLPGLRRLRLAAAHADPIADAVTHLSNRAGGGPVGVIAISYAAGPAVLAALRPALDARIGLMLLVGPYYDMEAALTYLTTGAYRTGPEAPWQFGRPNPRGIWLFIAGNADRLPAARDRRLLRRIAERKRADPRASVDRLAARLSADGRAVYALASARDPDRVPALIDALPAAIRAELAALDLSRRNLGRLPGQIRLLHGRRDPIIPFTESQRLRAQLPADRTRLYLTDGLVHADLSGVSLGDVGSLLDLTYDLLSWRDAAPRPALEGLEAIGN